MNDNDRNEDPQPTNGGKGTPPPKVNLFRELKAAFLAIWSNLGLVILMSVTWALFVSFPLSLAYWMPRSLPAVIRYLPLILMPIFGAIPAVGAAVIAQEIASLREATFAVFWREGWRLKALSIRLSLLHWATAAALTFSFWFYLRISHWSGRVALLICFYASLFWLMMTVYHYPLLAAQESGVFDEPDRKAKRGVVAVIRRSFYLVVGSPLYSFGLLSFLALFAALSLFTAVSPILLWGGVFALFSCFPVRALLVQYGILPAPTLPKKETNAVMRDRK